jgi:hypothetical protein
MKKLLILCVCMGVAGSAQGRRFTGYTGASTAAQEGVERTFRSLPSAEKAREYHRFLTSEPHPAGSERNRELAL